MRPTNRQGGFTLVEVLIVVVIMAILAATIIPQFTDSATDAKCSTAKFNLRTLRGQIELYRTQHGGKNPSDALEELTASTNAAGIVGTGESFPYGPYIRELPENPFTTSNSVTTITSSPAGPGDVTGVGGWLYNPTTAEVWIDHEEYYEE